MKPRSRTIRRSGRNSNRPRPRTRRTLFLLLKFLRLSARGKEIFLRHSAEDREEHNNLLIVAQELRSVLVCELRSRPLEHILLLIRVSEHGENLRRPAQEKSSAGLINHTRRFQNPFHLRGFKIRLPSQPQPVQELR